MSQGREFIDRCQDLNCKSHGQKLSFIDFHNTENRYGLCGICARSEHVQSIDKFQGVLERYREDAKFIKLQMENLGKLSTKLKNLCEEAEKRIAKCQEKALKYQGQVDKILEEMEGTQRFTRDSFDLFVAKLKEFIKCTKGGEWKIQAGLKQSTLLKIKGNFDLTPQKSNPEKSSLRWINAEASSIKAFWEMFTTKLEDKNPGNLERKQFIEGLRSHQINKVNLNDHKSSKILGEYKKEVETNPKLERLLKKLIPLTSLYDDLIVCGSNAALILNQLNIPFNFQNFEGIKLKDISLEGARFYMTSLKKATFINVNWKDAVIVESNLHDCCFKHQSLCWDEPKIIDPSVCQLCRKQKIHLLPCNHPIHVSCIGRLINKKIVTCQECNQQHNNRRYWRFSPMASDKMELEEDLDKELKQIFNEQALKQDLGCCRNIFCAYRCFFKLENYQDKDNKQLCPQCNMRSVVLIPPSLLG